jgi:hypothetical protein
VIKTAHMYYPKDYFRNWAAERDIFEGSLRGEWTSMTSTYGDRLEHTMFATAWRDRKLKMFLSNRSNTIRAMTDSVRSRHRVALVNGEPETIRYEKKIMRPSVVETIYKYFSVIDVHDHLRQGSLNFEEGWKTHTWWHRTFSTLLGMIITDCFLAMHYEDRHHQDTFAEFWGKLCFQLINNPLLKEEIIAERIAREEV